MKKLLFTAMVVLAFSGVSLAKTGEVEVIYPKLFTKIEITTEKFDKQYVDDGRNCDGARFQMRVQALRDGWSADDAASFAWSVYWDCKING